MNRQQIWCLFHPPDTWNLTGFYSQKITALWVTPLSGIPRCSSGFSGTFRNMSDSIGTLWFRASKRSQHETSHLAESPVSTHKRAHTHIFFRDSAMTFLRADLCHSARLLVIVDPRGGGGKSWPRWIWGDVSPPFRCLGMILFT